MVYTSTNYWLVVWNHGIRHDFPNILGRIIPTDELIFYRGVGSTTNQCMYMYMYIFTYIIEIYSSYSGGQINIYI